MEYFLWYEEKLWCFRVGLFAIQKCKTSISCLLKYGKTWKTELGCQAQQGFLWLPFMFSSCLISPKSKEISCYTFRYCRNFQSWLACLVGILISSVINNAWLKCWDFPLLQFISCLLGKAKWLWCFWPISVVIIVLCWILGCNVVIHLNSSSSLWRQPKMPVYQNHLCWNNQWGSRWFIGNSGRSPFVGASFVILRMARQCGMAVSGL